MSSKNKLFNHLYAFFIFFLFPGVSNAKFITLETKTNTLVMGNAVEATVEVTNKGDEPAYNLQISVDHYGEKMDSYMKDILNPQESFETLFKFKIPEKPAGRYSLIITVKYSDANEYPLSAVSYGYYSVKRDLFFNISGETKGIELAKKSRFNVKLKNLDENEKTCHVKLALPGELVGSNPEREIKLPSGKEKDISFHLKNLSALPGSHYQIFALIESTESNRHYSKIIPGSVRIVEEEKFLATLKGILLLAAAVLTLIVIFFNIKHRIKN